MGRTGSGKSSTILAILKFLYVKKGAVEIDGIDLSGVPVKRLRSAISIIPQDPVLFVGTVRSNLDPFSIYSDDQIWVALKQAHLAETIQSLPDKLQSTVEYGGENFSLGQRQVPKNRTMVVDWP